MRVNKLSHFQLESARKLSFRAKSRIVRRIVRVVEKVTYEDEGLLLSLAAGPLEDLMCSYGEEIIGRVESEEKLNPRFKSCIKGVWLDSKDTSVWKRFYQVAGIEPLSDD